MTDAGALARLRQGCYRFFAGALAAPSPSRAAELRAAAEYLESMGLDAYAFSTAWRSFVSTIPEPGDVETLSTEYVRLFASGAGGVLCPPVESHYRSDGRRETVAAVLAAIEADYRTLGIRVDPVGDPTDHAATQLEIMATLCAREAACWDDSTVRDGRDVLRSEATFLSRHLCAWVPAWRALVVEAQAAEHYRTLLVALEEFLVHDLDMARSLEQWVDA